MSERFLIRKGGVIGRERGHVQFVLDHPHVSRRHASLVVLQSGRPVLADLGSSTGTFVNGKRIAQPIELKTGDLVQIGPYSLTFENDELTSKTRSNNLELAVRDIRKVVHDRRGDPVVLLADVSLVVRPKELACILGPSGAGKTTLVRLLSGRTRPDRGSVTINGQDLHGHYGSLRHDIAVVGQRDTFHYDLTVEQLLRYTAELRLPPDTTRDEIARNVEESLRVVGLDHRRGTQLRNLSGGERKRAGLANEFIAGPSLLILDEATSGLDELTDRDMMELFRRVADTGKTVVCVTHNVSNVEAVASLIVFLTEGGRIAFIGTPREAKTYFGVNRLGDVYRKVALFPAEQWESAYRTSPLYRRYVTDRLPLTAAVAKMPEPEASEPVAPPFLSQTFVLIRRAIAIGASERLTFLTMLAQSLILAVLLVTLFGNVNVFADPAEGARQIVHLLFLLNVASFWFGCNNAVKEIVKERGIIDRERAVNLRIDSYFVAKLAVQSFLAVMQASACFAVVRLFCGPDGSPFAQWLPLALMAIAGTTLGLLISALARTEEMAITLIPLAVAPQIMFAGVIVPLAGVADVLSRVFIASRWSQGALESTVSDDLLAPLRVTHSYIEVGMVLVYSLLFAGLALLSLHLLENQRRDNAT